MTLSLDATVMVDLLRGHPDVRPRFTAALEAGEDLVICSVVLHELSYGAWRSGRAETKLQEIDTMLERLRVEPFAGEDALEAGRLRAHLNEHGGPLGAYDELIAAQALARGWPVVTSNLKHFLRVRGLRIADWRRADQPYSDAERVDLIAELLKDDK